MMEEMDVSPVFKSRVSIDGFFFSVYGSDFLVSLHVSQILLKPGHLK